MAFACGFWGQGLALVGCCCWWWWWWWCSCCARGELMAVVAVAKGALSWWEWHWSDPLAGPSASRTTPVLESSLGRLVRLGARSGASGSDVAFTCPTAETPKPRGPRGQRKTFFQTFSNFKQKKFPNKQTKFKIIHCQIPTLTTHRAPHHTTPHQRTVALLRQSQAVQSCRYDRSPAVPTDRPPHPRPAPPRPSHRVTQSISPCPS